MQEMRWINFNMRCIEIADNLTVIVFADLINFNMRCIEIPLS